MRRRKSSCPDPYEHHNRRTSLAPSNHSSSRNGVKLDLFIEDEELYTNGGGGRNRSTSPSAHSSSSPDHRRQSSSKNIEDLAEEVLCLRLLSTKTRYRFGGLQVHIISPVFNMDKLFNVEFDQDSQVSLIKSQQSNFDQQTANSSSLGSLDPKLINGAKTATIVVSPDNEDELDDRSVDAANKKDISTVSAELTLFEEPNRFSISRTPITLSAHSLTKMDNVNESEKRQSGSPSASSFDNSVRFNNVKVYANMDHHNQNHLSETIDLETKDLQSVRKQKNKITAQRRHTHYYCYVPANLTSGNTRYNPQCYSQDDLTASSSTSNVNGRHLTIRKIFGKKVSDTWHSAVRVKKYLSESLSVFK